MATSLLELTIVNNVANVCYVWIITGTPWVNNCVGHYNYGYFIRFLFYVDIACTYHLVMLTQRVRDAVSVTAFSVRLQLPVPTFQGIKWRMQRDPSTSEVLFVVFNYATCVPVLICVGFFSLYHFYCLLTNTTTIEGWEKDKVATLIRRGKIREIKFPYHLGMRENVRVILGSNPLLWCWPAVMKGDGLRFPVAAGTGKWIEFYRQPQDSSAAPMTDDRIEEHMPPIDDVSSSRVHYDAPPYAGGVPVHGYGQSVLPSGIENDTSRLEARHGVIGGPGGSLLRCRVDVNPEVQDIWPPKDPAQYNERIGPRFMGDSPFTYGNGFNPNLEASNSQLRSRHRTSRRAAEAEDEDNERLSTSTPSRESFSSNEYPNHSTNQGDGYTDGEEDDDNALISGSVRVRRGSEGWEVRPLNKEEIIARYVATRRLEDESVQPLRDPPSDPIQQPGRYNRYVPESYESDGRDLDDSVPY
ncbi:Palmitoyltransferase [Tulasnella sp. 427]|nr:Palmitoyltransferase [Tulasnella sp. 427]